LSRAGVTRSTMLRRALSVVYSTSPLPGWLPSLATSKLQRVSVPRAMQRM
jgi:hypothetical protein